MIEPIETRSDIRSRVIRASLTEVFAAMSDPDRVARWWGPSGFTNTIHEFDFREGGRWRLTMTGPDGQSFPNESRFTRIVPNSLIEIDHVSGHHFVLALRLVAVDAGTEVHWRQTFDTREHFEELSAFIAGANQQNLERLEAEVLRR